jgi:hypothetical protein
MRQVRGAGRARRRTLRARLADQVGAEREEAERKRKAEDERCRRERLAQLEKARKRSPSRTRAGSASGAAVSRLCRSVRALNATSADPWPPTTLRPGQLGVGAGRPNRSRRFRRLHDATDGETQGDARRVTSAKPLRWQSNSPATHRRVVRRLPRRLREGSRRPQAFVVPVVYLILRL